MTKPKDLISFEIDGKRVQGDRNETILQVARRNGIYIPTMCYLTKLKPIASCRMCIVDIEGMDAPILSCQERAVEGLKVITNSPSLYEQRQSIMKLYDVNHPLQCGACPKSGECDLQNKTLEFGVGAQSFSAVDQQREIQDWGNVTYDPYLCIMCERCVRVSNEIIGDEALQIKAGGYNSTIINTKIEDHNVDWGECASVCPVGALADKDFSYNTNAWELTRIPAACSHSSLAPLIYYEVKRNEIYRVRNEYEFDTMAGVCRYGYDFQNRGSNSSEDMKRAVEAFKKADTIKFNSIITNEEALILQRLKEKFGYKLVNSEAYSYKKFLNAFSSTTGRSLYQGTSGDIKDSDYIIVMGSRIADDSPVLKFKVNQASKIRKAQVIYMHPIEDASIKNFITQFVKYEVGSEEGVLAMVAQMLLQDAPLTKQVKSVLDDLDIGYLSAESNIGEEEIDEMKSRMKRKERCSFVVGSDLYTHPKSENIAKLLGLIEKHTGFEVVLTPPSVNTLGVAMICDLDEEVGEYVIGYNEEADFVLSSIENVGDVNLPAINQQEGTFTNMNKIVVPTNAAVSFDGFCLNDIANEVGLPYKRYTIDYTPFLPLSSGYREVEFDSLDNHFDSNGNERRGYRLLSQRHSMQNTLEEISEIESYDGTIIYLCNPNSQKDVFTNLCKYLKTDGDILGSSQFSIAAKIKDGDLLRVTINGKEVEKKFRLVDSLKGTIAMMPIFDLGFSGQLLKDGYRFSKSKIEQVDK